MGGRDNSARNSAPAPKNEAAKNEADWVPVGVVGGPKGVRGAVRIATFTDRPANIAAYGPVYDAPGGRPLTIETRETTKTGVVAVIAGVSDRESATRLRGTRLYLPRAALPPPKADEFYHCDLIGLRVEHEDGTALGTVAAVYDTGAGDVIEVEGGARPLLLPFTKTVVPRVDIGGGRLVVSPPEGMF